MKIYLASRYSRRLELCVYRQELEYLGHTVQARWLDGKHQIDSAGKPIGEGGEVAVESDTEEHAVMRGQFAQDDFEDCSTADVIVNFTEEPRSTALNASRGGRHVELGIALATGATVIVVGHRENIFHWLPTIQFFPTWNLARLFIGRTA